MALREHEGELHGDGPDDTREMLAEYSRVNYPVELFVDCVCVCGNRKLLLQVCTEEGVAVRTCLSCGEQHVMFDGGNYLEDADLADAECLCGGDELEITAGVALYSNEQSVRWLYVGGRCPECGRIACYGDWKNEADLKGFLERA
jgi:hypothetical protein